VNEHDFGVKNEKSSVDIIEGDFQRLLPKEIGNCSRKTLNTK